jgi:hypothetical protein
MWKFIVSLLFSGNLFAMVQLSLDGSFSRTQNEVANVKIKSSHLLNSAFLSYGAPDIKVGAIYMYSKSDDTTIDTFIGLGASLGTNFFLDIAAGIVKLESVEKDGWGALLRPGYRFPITSNILLKGGLTAYYRKNENNSSLFFAPVVGLDIVF